MTDVLSGDAGHAVIMASIGIVVGWMTWQIREARQTAKSDLAAMVVLQNHSTEAVAHDLAALVERFDALIAGNHVKVYDFVALRDEVAEIHRKQAVVLAAMERLNALKLSRSRSMSDPPGS